MRNTIRTCMVVFATLLVTGCWAAFAHADDRLKANISVNELPAITAENLADADYFPVYDSSAVNWKKTPATNFKGGTAVITICGDGTTINNNTVYYGPSRTPVASGERTCDITAAGNATEATADAPAFPAAMQVISMDCLTADPGAAGVSFTLRNNAAATVPSVTCSVANGGLGCATNTHTTTAIAANNPISIAAASTGDQGITPFACQIHVRY